MVPMKKYFRTLTACLILGTAFTAADIFAKSAKTSNPKSKPFPLQYVLQEIRGNVLIRDKKTGKTERALEEETIQSGDEVMTQSGSKASLTLNKNTMFHLYENTKIKVDQLAHQKTNPGFISRLSLFSGKILSEVEDLKKSHSSFEISSGGIVCGVRGTAFTVENQGKSVQTSTYHGVVEVEKDGQSKRVEADQNLDFAFDKDTFLPKRTLTQKEREYYLDWLKQKALSSGSFWNAKPSSTPCRP